MSEILMKIALTYIAIGLAIGAFMIITMGSPGSWDRYPKLILGWPVILWMVWTRRID